MLEEQDTGERRPAWGTYLYWGGLSQWSVFMEDCYWVLFGFGGSEVPRYVKGEGTKAGDVKADEALLGNRSPERTGWSIGCEMGGR
jgi:hypothetical protein